MWEYLVKKVRPRRGEGESADLHPVHAPQPAGSSGRVQAGRGGGEEGASEGSTGPSGRAEGTRRLRCPVCGTEMSIEYIGKVEIDRCPDCRGIFLDKGELQEIKGRDFSSYRPESTHHENLIYTPHGLSDHVTDHPGTD